MSVEVATGFEAKFIRTWKEWNIKDGIFTVQFYDVELNDWLAEKVGFRTALSVYFDFDKMSVDIFPYNEGDEADIEIVSFNLEVGIKEL